MWSSEADVAAGDRAASARTGQRAEPGRSADEVPEWRQRALGYRVAKRAMDLLLSVPLLVLALPLQVAIALLIRLDSSGPALWRQVRLGLDRRLFVLYKFRTMYADARERFPHFYDYHAIIVREGKLPLKHPGDPRITRVGRWLRLTSLDELPNLWNVLGGEMSLVGPRPEIPELLPLYSAERLQMFRVKPGVTGLAQIRGRNALTVAQTVDLDVEYARRASLQLDLSILARTLLRVVSCRNAY